MKNQRGFTGLEFLAVAAIGIFFASIVYPIVKPLIGGTSGTEKTLQTDSYKETMEPLTENGQPVKVKLSDGSEGLIFRRVVEKNALNQRTLPPAPLVERIVMWFVRLGILGLVLALAFPTAAITAWAWIRGRWKALAAALAAEKAAHAATKADTTKVVASVDNGLGVFDTAISAAQAAFDTAKTVAANTSDPNVTSANQAIMTTQQTISAVIAKLKQEFLDAMTKVQGQNSSAEALVTKAQQGTL